MKEHGWKKGDCSGTLDQDMATGIHYSLQHLG
jgi:hypothetical protein